MGSGIFSNIKPSYWVTVEVSDNCRISHLYLRARVEALPFAPSLRSQSSSLWSCGCLCWAYRGLTFPVNVQWVQTEKWQKLSKEDRLETWQAWSWILALWPWAGYANLLEAQFSHPSDEAQKRYLHSKWITYISWRIILHSTGNGLFLKVSVVYWIWATSGSAQMEEQLVFIEFSKWAFKNHY